MLGHMCCFDYRKAETCYWYSRIGTCPIELLDKLALLVFLGGKLKVKVFNLGERDKRKRARAKGKLSTESLEQRRKRKYGW